MIFWIFIYVKLGQGKKSAGNITYAFWVSKDMTTASQTRNRAVGQRYLQTGRKLGAGLEGKNIHLPKKLAIGVKSREKENGAE